MARKLAYCYDCNYVIEGKSVTIYADDLNKETYESIECPCRNSVLVIEKGTGKGSPCKCFDYRMRVDAETSWRVASRADLYMEIKDES